MGAEGLTDSEVLALVGAKIIPSYKLEAVLGDHERGVAIRCVVVESLAVC